MTVLQLVRGDEKGLEPLPNPDQLQPVQIFRQRKDAFLAGSDDLISIAFHLGQTDFRVLDFHIVDRFFVRVAEEEREWLSGELIQLIEAGKWQSLWDFVDRHMSGRFVEQVQFLSGADNHLSIAQQGVVNANEEDLASLRKGLTGVDPGL
ncbi:hypothetical protein MSP7336_01484 [Mycobacterium shimoidei]|uniref:Uncharacterized protein n=1 Tax=Mycobacterium shimoidei TaxID=29313 RepID=A0A375YWI9_MYCSH|nr:hypothetical protein [Mycobacterium shimoidei]SRX93248.1 hypothetical protein MSP7336_01484 [Mycobacterium shimoidei]